MIENNDNESTIDPVLYRDPEALPAQTFAIPNRALSVEAATLSLLQDDDKKALDKYSQFQATPRQDKNKWIQNEVDSAKQKYDSFIRGGIMNVVADPAIPAETRVNILDKAPNTSYAPNDPAVMLMQAGAVAPSAGETEVGSKVRGVLAESSLKAWAWVDEKQQIVNNAIGKRDSVTGQVADTISMLLTPLQDSIVAGKIAKQRGDNLTGAVALPGSYIKTLNEKFLKMNREDQLDFMRSLAGIVVNSSGILSSPNQLRAEALINDITDAEGYSSAEAMFTNAMNLLDLVGVGMTAKSIGVGVKQAARTAKGIRGASESALRGSASWFERQGMDIPLETPGAAPRPVPSDRPVREDLGNSRITSVPLENRTVDALEAEKQNLLGDLSRQLEPGQVRSLQEERKSLEQAAKETLPTAQLRQPGVATRMVERKADINAQIARIDEQLQANGVANRAEQRIAAIEKELEAAKKAEQLTPAPKNEIAAAIDRAYAQSFVAPSHPRAPGSILSSVNHEKGQLLYAQAVADETGQMAEAVYGTTRNEAIISQIAPQVSDVTGKVIQKMDNPEKAWRQFVSQGADEVVNNIRDGMRYTPNELAAARAAVVHDYTDTTGLVLNTAMTSHRWEGERFIFSGVYTNGQGGWTSAEEAVSQAKFALRNRGIDETHIEVMKLDGNEFVPVSKEVVAGQDGVFAVRLNVEDFIRDADVGAEWDKLDVKRNWLDRFAGSGAARSGSLQRHVFDPNSSLHKTLTGSMAVADDKSAIVTQFLLRQFTDFSDNYVKLDKVMKAKVDEYIREANVNELPFDRLALSNRFPDKVVDMLEQWRNSWDGMYMLENRDVIRALDRERYQIFKNSNIEAVVRETPKRYANNNVYDPASDTNRVLNNKEIDDVYKNGGYIGEFRSSMDLNGQQMEFMIVRNTPTEYARRLNDNDRILNYRNGYYQVSYKTPKFIDETFTDASGREVTKTVAVAGTTKEAKQIVERLSQSKPTSSFRARNDERSISRSHDVYWDLNQSYGRIAQRHRGKLLEDTVGIKPNMADDFIENPADSAMKASMSLGGRIAMRDTISTAKERWMRQFGHLVKKEFPSKFPASRDQIFVKGEQTSAELADARTTWEYINSMENGYINAMDETLKKGFNYIADVFGNAGYDTVEKLARATGDINLTGKVKGGVFTAYLATNPLRQWIVQSGQALRLAGYSTIHTPEVLNILRKWAAGDHPEFEAFYGATGINQSLHRNNLIRGTLLEAANRQTVSGRMFDKGVNMMRTVGFDAGEIVNNAAAAAAVFEKYVREGKDVKDLTVQANMHAETRALNRNMNRAGEMPYNQNYLALVFTYMQVPHKFATQWADRSLSRGERARLIAADLTLWGLPVGLGTYVASQPIMEKYPQLAQVVEDGMASWLVNKAFTNLSGQRTNIDFGSMAPYDLTGFHDMLIKDIMGNKGISALLTESPAGRVLGLSEDNRLGFAVKTTASFFKNINEDEFTRVSVGELADSWLRISSGWTNIQEAKIMYQLGRVQDKVGRTIDDQVSFPEIVAKVFGFGTKDASQYYESVMKAGETVKKAQDQAKQDVKSLMMMVRHQNEGDMNSARAIAQLSRIMADQSNFPDMQTHNAYLSKMYEEIQQPANYKMMQKFMGDMGLKGSPEGLAQAARMSSMTPEEKQAYSEFFRNMEAEFKKLEEANKGK